MTQRFKWLMIVLLPLVYGCSRRSDNSMVSLGERLNLKTFADKPDLAGRFVGQSVAHYVTRFVTVEEARRHSEDVMRHGGTLKLLDREGRVLSVTLPRKALDDLTVPVTALTSINSSISIRKAPVASGLNSENTGERSAVANDSMAFLTAREITGVSQLLKRFPDADGRNMKVAVFDTGIDFGVEGVDKNRDGSRKLVGFYDLTGFGKVALTDALSLDPPADSIDSKSFHYSVGGKSLTVPATLAKDVLMAGVLSEKQLAKAYYAHLGVDLDGNQKTDDEFLFVVGHNRVGEKAVWLDRDHNGAIDVVDGVSVEELTDYNSTFDFLNLDRSTPSGARPLAVTISEFAGKLAVQFHSMPGGHGTSCSIIIAGDGYANGHLSGMAPKAQLVSYVLDTVGEDVYSMDEFVAMFLHAKEQQVDAISLSWGFTTADLSSARFLADFLDKEIASAGVVIGIAAGNNGPGISSGLQDDYIPHHGFGIGAYISKTQARNVYGWTGDVADDIIFYSSFGPTRGMRQMPDVVSPLMTLVRGERGTVGQRFYGFGGTSSATPALIGSISALGSIIKAKTGERLDPRILKLAVNNAAQKIPGTSSIRQGQGLINVDASLEIYLKLYGELAAAKKDSWRRTPFAYDVRAAIAMNDSTATGEGIHLKEFAVKKTVKLALTEESLALVDALVFYEPVKLVSEGGFFETQEVIGLQGLPVSFDVALLANKLRLPGTYVGRVQVKRATDGIVLTTIPVVVEIPQGVDPLNQILSVNQQLKPLELIRRSVSLSSASPLVLKGLVTDTSGLSAASDLRFSVINSEGNAIVTNRTVLREVQNIVDFRTEIVPAGYYEVVLYRGFKQPAVLMPVDVTLSLSLPSVVLMASDWKPSLVSFSLKAARPLAFKSARLVLDKADQSVNLVLAPSHPSFGRPIKGFYGESEFSSAVNAVGARLTQSSVNRSLRPMANVELVAVDKNTSEVLYRGWKNFDDGSGVGPAFSIGFAQLATSIAWVAYPNIVHWERPLGDSQLNLSLVLPMAPTLAHQIQVDANLSGGDLVSTSFEIPSAEQAVIVPGISGRIELLDGNDKVIDRVAVRW